VTLGNDNGTDGRTDRRTDGQTDRVRRNMRPPPREEGRIINSYTALRLTAKQHRLLRPTGQTTVTILVAIANPKVCGTESLN